jgi:hypothetical protein
MATPNKSLARRVIPVGLVLAVCIWLAVARNTYWIWRYDYSHDLKNQIVETTVTFQDGHKRQLRFRDGILAGP